MRELLFPAQVAAEPSERTQVERLMQLMGQSEATWAEGYKAERERADGIARDLASVRAELAARVAVETAVRAENARMAKLLKARKAEGTKKLAAERQKSESTAKTRLACRSVPMVLRLPHAQKQLDSKHQHRVGNDRTSGNRRRARSGADGSNGPRR